MSSWINRFHRSSDPRATVMAWFEAASLLSLVMVAVGDTDLRVIAVNDTFADAFGMASADMTGLVVEDLTPPDEPALSRARRGSLLSGSWDCFRGWRRYQRPDGSVFEIEIIARSVRDDDGVPRYLAIEGRRAEAPAIAAAVWQLLDIIGPIVGRDGDLLCVVDVERMTCHPADTLVSLPDAPRGLPQELPLVELFDPDDVATVRELLHRASASGTVTGPVRVRAGTSSRRRPFDVIVRRWPGQQALLIAMCRDVELATQRGRGSGGRIHELESALTEIVESAREVLGASNAESLKGLSSAALDRLSRREREVLLLLLRGKRVPAIAAQLYISPSTVRNHLSRVFHKFGVATQSELLHLLLEG